MEKIIDNEFNEISFDKETSLHCHIVKATSSKMFADDFKAMLITWRETVFKLQPQLLLIDNRKQLFPISPDLQAWITEEVGAPVMHLPYVKNIIPENFITRLSMSQ